MLDWFYAFQLITSNKSFVPCLIDQELYGTLPFYNHYK